MPTFGAMHVSINLIVAMNNPSHQYGSLKASGPQTSVIIPTYNHAHYLRDAIQSVLNQTRTDYEIIVVDDGSDDNTREVVSDFGDSIRYIWQENQGLSAARNAGIKAARGNLIGLLDADDMYESRFLEILVDILDSNSSADGVYCSAQTIDKNNNVLPQVIGKEIPPDQLRDTLLRGGFFPPVCMLAHRYCYEELGYFDSSFQGAADWDMWLRMSRRYRIFSTNIVLVRYRISPESMSSDPEHMLDDRTRVLQKYYAGEPDDRLYWTSTHKMAMAYNYIQATIEFLQTGDLDRGSQNLYKAFTIYPEISEVYEVFYTLGIGGQPSGFRTDLTSLNLDKNASILLAMMDDLFSKPEVHEKLGKYRKSAYANTYFALGILAYGSRRMRLSQRFLLQAVATDIRLASKYKVISTSLKSLLGGAAIDRYRVLRQRNSIQ